MKKILILLTMMLTLTFVGCSSNDVQVIVPEEENFYRSVAIMQIKSQELSESYKVFAKVVPDDELTLGAPGGVISELLVSVGDYVTAGEALYKIDTEEAQDIAINVAEAAEAKYNQQKPQAAFNVTSSELIYNDAILLYEKTEALFNEGIVTLVELESRMSSVEKAKINYDKAVSNYDTIEKPDTAIIIDSEVISPMDGVISYVRISEGEYASPKDIVITTERNVINALVSGRVVRQLEIGDKVEVIFENNNYMGIIEAIDPKGLNNTDSVLITVSIDEETILKPGFDVDVEFSINNIKNQILIPKKAVLTDESGDYVYLYEDSKVIKAPITQGITTNGQVQVFGLFRGEQLVVSGQSFVNDGDEVELAISSK